MDEFQDLTLGEITWRLAAPTPTPGGGAAAGLAAVLAAAVAQMVAAGTLDRRRYRESWDEARAIVERVATLRGELLEAAAEDARVYQQVILLLKHQNEANNEAAVRALEDALKAAAQVPLKITRLAAETARLAQRMVQIGNRHAAADAAVAVFLAQAAVRGSVLNIKVNLREVGDEKLARRWINEGGRLQQEVDQLAAEVGSLVENRFQETKSDRPRRSRRSDPPADHAA